MADRICEKCGEHFTITGGLARWCDSCRTLTCENCGTKKLVSPNTAHHRFCSVPCRVEWNKVHAEERFWGNVDKSGECWLWIGGCTSHGYGLFSVTGGKRSSAHRFSYELAKGPIPEGKEVCHSCDVTNCVNPEHLFAGTHTENIHDSMRKGRARSGSALGEAHHNHKVTPDDVRKLRAIYDAGGVGCTTLGRMFGIHEDTARQIAKRKTWRHVV